MTDTDTIQIQQVRPEYYLNDSLSGYVYDSLPTYEIYDTTIEIDSSMVWKNHFVPRNKWTKRNDFVGDWAVIIFTLSFVLLAVVKNTAGSYLTNLLQSIFNYQTANRLYREKVNTLMHPSLGLDVLFYLTMALYFFHAEKYFLVEFPYPEWLIYLFNFVVFYLYNTLKYGSYRFSGILFDNSTLINEFLFHIKLFNKTTAIFLMPVALSIFFSPIYVRETLLALGALIILFSLIFSLFRSIKIISLKGIPIYYMILYLCTLEILPLLIAWRILWIYNR
jgi:hypothetical protein